MENSQILKPRIRTKKIVPKINSILAVFAAVIILLGIIESVFIFALTTLETIIATAILLIFYVFLLALLMKPRIVRIVEKRAVTNKMEKPQTFVKDITEEISKPSEENSTIKKKRKYTRKRKYNQKKATN